MGLVALFLTAAVTSTLDLILGNVKSSVQQEVQENLRYATHRIQFEIRNADSINEALSSFGVNLATNPAAKVSFTAPAPYNPLEFQVAGGELQIKSAAGEVEEDEELEWRSLTGRTVEVTNLVFTNLSEPQFLACGTNLACCFVATHGGYVCENLAHHGGLLFGRDCVGELGGGTLNHHDNCKTTLYRNVRFTITLRYRNPSGQPQWAKEATFDGDMQLR